LRSFSVSCFASHEERNRNMKIQYKFVDKTVEIEVDDDWGNLVIDLDRQEYNNDHAETRRHASLSAMSYEGDYFEDDRADLSGYADVLVLREAIKKLPERQREIIHLHFFEELGIREIARQLGLDHSTVRESLNSAIKNLKKNF